MHTSRQVDGANWKHVDEEYEMRMTLFTKTTIHRSEDSDSKEMDLIPTHNPKCFFCKFSCSEMTICQRLVMLP